MSTPSPPGPERRPPAGKASLVQEYCANGTLASRLKGSPWNPRSAATLARTLARAVQAAHGAGIVHRDLKPANVPLQAEPGANPKDEGLGGLVPKVGDF